MARVKRGVIARARHKKILKKRKQLWHKPVKRGSLAPSLLFVVQSIS